MGLKMSPSISFDSQPTTFLGPLGPTSIYLTLQTIKMVEIERTPVFLYNVYWNAYRGVQVPACRVLARSHHPLAHPNSHRVSSLEAIDRTGKVRTSSFLK